MNSNTNGTWEVIDGKLVDTDPAIFDQGYWVAITNTVALDENQLDGLVLGHIENGAKFVGIWYDKDKDVTFVDETELVGDLIDAIKLGRKHHQDAIWDIAHKTEIHI